MDAIIKTKWKGIEVTIKLSNQGRTSGYHLTTTNYTEKMGNFNGEHYVYNPPNYPLHAFGQEYSFTHPTTFADYAHHLNVSVGDIYTLIKTYNNTVLRAVQEFLINNRQKINP